MESRCDGDFQDVGPAIQKSSPSLSFQIYKWSKFFKITVANMILPSPPPLQPTGWGPMGPLGSKHLSASLRPVTASTEALGNGLWTCGCPLPKAATATHPHHPESWPSSWDG